MSHAKIQHARSVWLIVYARMIENPTAGGRNMKASWLHRISISTSLFQDVTWTRERKTRRELISDIDGEVGRKFTQNLFNQEKSL